MAQSQNFYSLRFEENVPYPLLTPIPYSHPEVVSDFVEGFHLVT